MPKVLLDSPSFWNEHYQKLVSEIRLSWTLGECIDEIRKLLTLLGPIEYQYLESNFSHKT